MNRIALSKKTTRTDALHEVFRTSGIPRIGSALRSILAPLAPPQWPFAIFKKSGPRIERPARLVVRYFVDGHPAFSCPGVRPRRTSHLFRTLHPAFARHCLRGERRRHMVHRSRVQESQAPPRQSVARLTFSKASPELLYSAIDSVFTPVVFKCEEGSCATSFRKMP